MLSVPSCDEDVVISDYICRSVDGSTPLHVAAAWGDKDTLQLLLHNGADPNLVDQVWQNVLCQCVYFGLKQAFWTCTSCTCMYVCSWQLGRLCGQKQ